MQAFHTPAQHRLWPWLLGIALTPFVACAMLAASVVRLNADAALLRREITGASGARWRTLVQLNVPQAGFAAAREIVGRIEDLPPEAREALDAVRSASVGVYQCRATELQQGLPVAAIDEAMAGRGWTRLAGVVDRDDVVLVYLSPAGATATPGRICVAVRSGTQLVVVASDFDGPALARLAVGAVERHRDSLRL